MGYEYKEEILLDIGSEPNCNYESESNRYYDKIDELEHVYSRASKADEYEAKAKAFDRIKAYSDKAINGDIHSLLLAEGIIDVVEQYDINRLSESGEYDV